jgi:hypothetical protein
LNRVAGPLFSKREPISRLQKTQSALLIIIRHNSKKINPILPIFSIFSQKLAKVFPKLTSKNAQRLNALKNSRQKQIIFKNLQPIFAKELENRVKGKYNRTEEGATFPQAK